VELYLHSPNTPSWRGAHLKHKDNFTFTLYVVERLVIVEFRNVILTSTFRNSKRAYKATILPFVLYDPLRSGKNMNYIVLERTVFRKMFSSNTVKVREPG
jgi:ribosomal protein L13